MTTLNGFAPKDILARTKRVVIKVGSAVLTTEQGLDLRTVSRLVDQVATLHDMGLDIVMVSSGSVAAGKSLVRDKASLADTRSKQAAAAIGQSRLMHEYDQAFFRCSKVTAQILLTRDDFRNRNRYLNARNTLTRLLDWRVIPIANENDTLAVQELEFGDNDCLASLMLGLAGADLFLNLTTASGVYEANPDLNPDAERIRFIDNISDLDLDNLCKGKSVTGSGGMHSKLLAGQRAAQLGVPTLIVPGREHMALERAFAGEDVGTWIVPDEKIISRRKFWMAYHDRPAGSIVVDSGAADALAKRGKSLLPAGIVAVLGSFEQGSLVRIMDRDEHTIGVGLTSYSSRDLDSIKGLKSAEIAAALGPGHHAAEAMHRDNLLLDPAI